MIRVIHMIGGLNLGGSQAMVMNIYRSIDRSNIQFDFILDEPEQVDLLEEVKSLGAHVFVMPKLNGKNIFTVRKAWNDFFSEHPEYKILHSHVRSYASVFLPIAKKHGVKTIIHSHSTSNGSGFSALIKSLLQYRIRFQADYFMACSQEAGVWLFGKEVTDKNSFFLVKNAIDAKKFVFNLEKRNNIRSELRIEDDTFLLGALGRVVSPKNPEFIIDVFAKYHELNSNSKLLYVGDGELLSAIKDKVLKMGLAKQVIFTGTRMDTDRLFCAMDYYIFPSLWEGLGISLVEAQASGLKCLCSENVPHSAFVTDNVRVMRLDEGCTAWAKAIFNEETCFQRKDQYNNVSNNGYDIVDQVKWVSDFYCEIAK